MPLAFDAASTIVTNSGGSSGSGNHTITGSNPVLLVAVQLTDATVTVSTITWNAVQNLALLKAVNIPNSSRRIEIWGLKAPTTGLHAVAITLSGAVVTEFSAGAASYTGARQSFGLPDASDSYSVNSGVTDVLKSLTSQADNCWFFAAICNGSALNPVADAGTTIRQSIYNRTGNGYELFLVDSNAAKTPAGSQSLGITSDSTGGVMAIVSIQPELVVSETVILSDSILVSNAISVSDTVTTSDTQKSKYGWVEGNKSSASWTNQQQS